MKTREALSGLWLFSMVGTALFAMGSVVPSAGCTGSTETQPMDGGTDGPAFVDGGGTIPDPPNGPSLCPQGACNYQTNAGCAANQTCVPLPDGMGSAPPGCIGAGTAASGATCTNFDECAPGFICALGQCRKLCCGGDWSGCPTENEHCIQNLNVSDGMGGAIKSGAMLCMPVNTCDPLQPNVGCASGTACLIVDPTGATACFPEGSGVSGDPCPCKGGFLCVDNECRRLCKAVEGGGEPTCQEGEGICVHYARDPDGVGECTPEE
ncbi:MAG: hypothetical protein IPK82_15705 [Polyangiaceae bacterium]|nr:hypothetical protein [Polyangiaceae bacterium]